MGQHDRYRGTRMDLGSTSQVINPTGEGSVRAANKRDHISKLPPEVLTRILHHLDTRGVFFLQQLSRFYRDFVKGTPSLFKAIRMGLVRNAKNTSIVLNLTGSVPLEIMISREDVQTLRTSEISEALTLILQQIHRISVLRVALCPELLGHFMGLQEEAPLLEALNLECGHELCRDEPCNLSAMSFPRPFLRTPRLRELKVSLPLRDATWLPSISGILTGRMKSLTVENCTGSTLYCPAMDTLISTIFAAQNLESLVLSNCLSIAAGDFHAVTVTVALKHLAISVATFHEASALFSRVSLPHVQSIDLHVEDYDQKDGEELLAHLLSTLPLSSRRAMSFSAVFSQFRGRYALSLRMENPNHATLHLKAMWRHSTCGVDSAKLFDNITPHIDFAALQECRLDVAKIPPGFMRALDRSTLEYLTLMGGCAGDFCFVLKQDSFSQLKELCLDDVDFREDVCEYQLFQYLKVKRERQKVLKVLSLGDLCRFPVGMTMELEKVTENLVFGAPEYCD